MAELPKYRPLGVTIQPLPGVDFAAAGRAKASAYNEVTRGLDVMSKYVYEKQVAATKREAAKYAFENPITAEQLAAAKAGEIDLNDISGDPDTVFGAVTRATIAQQVTAQLEGSARNRLSEWAAMIDGGADVDIEEMRRDITGMSNGNAEVIAQLNPELATKYSASIATLAAPIYKSALERDLKLRQSQAKATVSVQAESLGDALRNIYKQDRGAVVEGTTVLESVAAADVAIGVLGNSARATNDAAYAVSVQADAMKLNNQVKRDVLSEHIQSLPKEKQLSALRTGNLGEKTALYNTMSDADKIEFRKQVRSEIAARQTIDDQIEKEQLADYKKSTVVQVMSYAEAPAGSPEERIALDGLTEIAVLSNGQAIDGQGILALKKAKTASASEETPNYVAEFRIKQMINAEQITTFDELRTEAAALGVGPKATLGLIPYLDSTTKETRREVDREAKAHAAIVPGMLNVSKKKAERHNRFVNAVENRFADDMEAWEENPDRRLKDKPVIAKIAKEYRKELLQSEHQKKINTTVTGLSKKYPNLDITENSEYEYFATNKVALGLSDTDLKDIKRKLGFIEQQALLRDEIR